MKKYIYVAGTFAFALAMSGLPVSAFADENSGESKQSSEDWQEQKIGWQENRPELKSPDEQKDDEEMKDEDQGEFEFELEDEFEFELEDDEDVASSFEDLKQKIEERKHELEDEGASTTPKFKNAMKNANEVRLAVHALLASRDLLGGIGEQVSEIAKHMNDSVATTTSAEAQIESRGFLVKLFFGGDQKVAKVISKEVERNQESIEKLTELLGQANLSAGIKTALEEQITALGDVQARFQALAEKEQKLWGIFSWRF